MVLHRICQNRCEVFDRAAVILGDHGPLVVRFQKQTETFDVTQITADLTVAPNLPMQSPILRLIEFRNGVIQPSSHNA